MLLSLLAACAGPGAGYKVERMRKAEPSGNAFTQALTEEYRKLALFEADEMADYRDAEHHSLKGLAAASGEVVDPDEVGSRDIPADKVDELTAARAEMMALFGQGARDKEPALSAQAQASFDCWLEQQEENIQPDHIAACRDRFNAAIEQLKAAMAPKPAAQPAPAPTPTPAPAAAVPEAFIVYFGFDSTRINPAGQAKVNDAVQAAKKLSTSDFSVTGHADRAGPAEYNLNLSLKRANAVRDALVALGYGSSDISVGGRGEAENAVSTADGVKEQANRRVEIIIIP
jgi:OOP family OmpA-OmpF porin